MHFVRCALHHAACAALLLSGAGAVTLAQRNDCGPAGARDPYSTYPTAKYDGRFTFARIYYTEYLGGGRRGRGEPMWHHDYPNAEQHLSKLVSSLSSVRARLDGSVIVALTDPLLFKFPIAYMSEPGHWYPNEQEVLAMRAYLKKGGFVIFDDFANNDIYNLQEQMERVLPKMKMIELKPDHPVFDSFYRVKSLEYVHPYYCVKSQFFGIFEDNDPTKRMLAIANYNNDLGELWEFSDWGYYAVNTSNEAYKLGLNYLIYALSR